MNEFNELGQAIFGDNWKGRLARYFGYHRRTVGRWCTGEYVVPEDVMAELRQMLEGTDIRND